MVDDNFKGCESDPETGDRIAGQDFTKVKGDPGVGGLLADPEEPSSGKPHVKPRGTPSPDPAPPAEHGDWAPNRKWQGRR